MRIVVLATLSIPLAFGQSSAPAGIEGSWSSEGVPFAPWVFQFTGTGANMKGTVRQGSRDVATKDTTTLTDDIAIRDLTFRDGVVTFEIERPQRTGTVSFRGELKGDSIDFTRQLLLAPGADPGRNGLYGSTGPTRFTLNRDDDATLQARSLLRKAERTYTTGPSWAIEGSTTLQMDGPIHATTESGVKSYSKSLTMTRMEMTMGRIALGTTVCDGTYQWANVGLLNTYSRTPLPATCATQEAALRQAVETLGSPRVVGRDKVELGGRSIECVLVHGVPRGGDTPASLNVVPGGVVRQELTLCIDPDGGTVLRQDLSATVPQPAGETQLKGTTRYTRMEKDPQLDAAVFKYEPPPGATLAPLPTAQTTPQAPRAPTIAPTAAGGGIGAGAYRIGGGVGPPTLLDKVEPTYTEEARKGRVEGTVRLDIVVDANGKATQMRVAKSLDPGLDQKAMEAVAQWRFKPGTKDGQPVSVIAAVEVSFRLLDTPR